MAVARMKYLNVYGPEKMLQQALGAIARSECFAPESNEAIHSAIQLGAANVCEPLLTKAKGLLKDLGSSSLAADFVGPEDTYDYKQVSATLESFAADVAARSKRKAEMENELEIQKKTEGLLSHMTDMDFDIEDLFRVDYLKVRVGRLPKNSYVRLAYYAEKGFNFASHFNFLVYDFDGEYYWGLYFAPADSAKEIDDIFNSLYFERIWVPEFVHGRPEEALTRIRARVKELESELANLASPGGMVSEEELNTIRNMTAWLSYQNQLFEMQKYALVYGHTFYISGFVPQDDYPKFEKVIDGIEAVNIKEAQKSEELPVRPPVKLKNHWFAQPYEMFTEMYGLPSYNDIDPTFMVSVLYSVLYGLMFADLGQGLVLGLVGYFLMYRKKHMAIGRILTRAAFFSCLFGLLFGSVFGYEHLLDPLWVSFGFEGKPFDVLSSATINTILIGAIAIGVVVVGVSMATAIFSKFSRGMPGEAITDPNGIAGFIFYFALVGLLLDMVLLGKGFAMTPYYIVPLIVVPLLVMYLREPLAGVINGKGFHVHSWADLLISGFFELFVTMLEYLSNTVSFLRVGGFVLAHAGMMSVVETLAEMAGALSPLVMLIGNVFVICLEGLIVGIQALRLNYYEVFSRFYEADGKPFEPLRIRSDTVEL